MDSRIKRRYEMQKKTSQKQKEEIEKLRRKLYNLEDMCERKDDLIMSVKNIRGDLNITIDDLKKKYKEYDDMLSELKEMKSIIDKVIFKGKWKLVRPIIRLLLR